MPGFISPGEGKMTEEDKGFVVRDRRMFAKEEEEATQAGDERTEPEPAAEEERQQAAASPPEADDGAAADMPPLPKINFPTFIASLNASALVHLGIIEDPASNARQKNLPMAKQTIDILSMLEEKTSGNLTADEANLLKNILYELRLMYVKEKK
jgi:hypothetical protein